MPQAPWPGRIFLDAGLILYVGPGARAEEHAHNAVQLVRSLDGPFEVTVEGKTVSRSAVLVAANMQHALNATGRVIALLLVESHGTRGDALNRAAKTASLRDLGETLASVPFPERDLRPADVTGWCDRIIRAIGVDASRSPIGAHTRRTIEYIEQHLDGVPRVADVAQKLSLSETRMTHLFSDEVGIPFRRFVLWTRIKRVASAAQRGNDLTGAAIAAGFSDAAHFSRTFKAMFGLSPSLVLSVAEVVGEIWPPQP